MRQWNSQSTTPGEVGCLLLPGAKRMIYHPVHLLPVAALIALFLPIRSQASDAVTDTSHLHLPSAAAQFKRALQLSPFDPEVWDLLVHCKRVIPWSNGETMPLQMKVIDYQPGRLYRLPQPESHRGRSSYGSARFSHDSAGCVWLPGD